MYGPGWLGADAANLPFFGGMVFWKLHASRSLSLSLALQAALGHRIWYDVLKRKELAPAQT